MKKIMTLIAVILMSCVLAACGKKEEKKPETPAWILEQDFEDTIKANKDMTTEEMANHLLENKLIPFAPAAMPVEEGFLSGFTDEIHGFSEGTMFGPMIGSIPFIGYVFRSDDTAALVKVLKEKADKNWNICTQADEMVCEEAEGMVFFVMSPAKFE